jgi:hypothetical protein
MKPKGVGSKYGRFANRKDYYKELLKNGTYGL